MPDLLVPVAVVGMTLTMALAGHHFAGASRGDAEHATASAGAAHRRGRSRRAMIARAPNGHVEAKLERDVLRVVFVGEFDVLLRVGADGLRELAAGDLRRVVVDVEAVTSGDTAMLAVLVLLHDLARLADADMRVIGHNPHVDAVLGDACLTDLFNRTPSGGA